MGESIDISIDVNEQKKDYFSRQFNKHGVRYRIEPLPVGDFVVYGKDEQDAIIVERKDKKDFLSSVEGNKDPLTGLYKKGRIWDQMKRMSEVECKMKYLLIEGNPFDKRLTVYRKKAFDKNRIWGAMCGVDKYGVHRHQTSDIDETIEWLVYLVKRQNRPKRRFALRVSAPNYMTLEEKKVYLIEGISGIGPSTADNLLEDWGTIYNMIQNVDNLHKTRGVGSKTVESIREVFFE